MKLTRINVTSEKVFGVCSYNKETKCKELYVQILGALIPITADATMGKGKFYYGKLDFENLSEIKMVEFSEVETVKGLRSYSRKGNVGQEQSQYQHYDAYLVKCKHTLYDEGLRAGTPEWRTKIDSAAKLYAAFNNVPLHISKDTKQWYK